MGSTWTGSTSGWAFAALLCVQAAPASDKDKPTTLAGNVALLRRLRGTPLFLSAIIASG